MASQKIKAFATIPNPYVPKKSQANIWVTTVVPAKIYTFFAFGIRHIASNVAPALPPPKLVHAT